MTFLVKWRFSKLKIQFSRSGKLRLRWKLVHTVFEYGEHDVVGISSIRAFLKKLKFSTLPKKWIFELFRKAWIELIPTASCSSYSKTVVYKFSAQTDHPWARKFNFQHQNCQKSTIYKESHRNKLLNVKTTSDSWFSAIFYPI